MWIYDCMNIIFNARYVCDEGRDHLQNLINFDDHIAASDFLDSDGTLQTAFKPTGHRWHEDEGFDHIC